MFKKKSARFLLIFIITVALLLLSACSGGEMYDSAVDVGYGDKNMNGGDTDIGTDSGIAELNPGGKIIRNVVLRGETKDFDTALATLKNKIAENGGYVEKSNVTGGESLNSNRRNSRNAVYTIRIPAEKLDAFLGEVGGLLHITSQRSNVQNVTNEYYDIEARLNVLESERTAYEAMLQSAKTTSEMLSIRDRLYDVIEEIEAYKTRLRVLESQVAYSTVHMTLSEVVEYSKVSEQDETFGDRIYDAFWTGWYSFVDNAEDFAVWFVRNVTTIGTLAIIGLIVLVVVITNNKKHAPTPPVTPSEPRVDKNAAKKAKKTAKKAEKKARKAEKSANKKNAKAEKKNAKKAKKAEKKAAKLAKKNALCYVAICNNVIAGYLLSYPEEENYTSNLHEESLKDNNTSQKIFSIWYLHDIAVHPSFNGRNIAKKLYHIALEEAKTLNLKKSKLVAVQNAAAFWTKLGYQEIAKPDANAGYSSEAIIMEKELI